jgi:hypothetical protein
MPCEDTGLTASLKPRELKMDLLHSDRRGALAKYIFEFADRSFGKLFDVRLAEERGAKAVVCGREKRRENLRSRMSKPKRIQRSRAKDWHFYRLIDGITVMKEGFR